MKQIPEENRRRNNHLATYPTKYEKELIHRAAKIKGDTVSTFLVSAGIKEAKEILKHQYVLQN